MLLDDRPGFIRESLYVAGRQFKDACLFSPVVVGPLQHGRLVALTMTLVFNAMSQKRALSPRFCQTL